MATLNFQGGRLVLGTEYVSYTINIYEPGTTTAKTTYKDSALTVGNENTATITLDANGAAQIWYSGNAKWVFKDTAGATVYTDDNVNLSATTSNTGTGNLALNPSFESDTDADGIPDNWTRTLYSGGAFAIDTTDSYGGAQSIKFTSTGTGGGYVTSESTFAVSPSVIYSIGFALKGTADVRNTVDILWYQKDGSASATASTNVYDNSTTNPTSWTEKWYEVTSPSDSAFAAIRLTGCHSSDATAGNTRFDQIFFTDFSHKREHKGAFNYLAASGTDTYTATFSPALTAYTTGAEYNLKIANANTSATPTLNINSLGAKTIVKEGAVALLVGDMPANHEAKFRYNGTNMVLLNPPPTVAVSSQAVGVGQTWQDRTSVRAIGSNYQNTTGRPLMISVKLLSANNFQHILKVGIGTPPTIEIAYTHAVGGDSTNTIVIIIPVDWYYKIDTTGGGSLSSWYELLV